MGKSKTTSSKSEPWAAAQPHLKHIMNRASGMSRDQSVPDMSSATSNALDMAENRAMDGNGLFSQSRDTLSGFMGPQQANLDGVADSVRDHVQPRVNANALLAGRQGSPAHAASMSRAMTSALAPHAYGAHENAQNRSMQAARLAPQIGNADLSSLMKVGRTRENYDAQQLNQEWNNLSRYNALVQGHAGLGGTSSQKQPGNLFGDVIAAAGTAASFFSDRRLKTDVRKIGTADNGLNIYSYRYISGGPIHIGFMADEVEKVSPNAVREVEGYKVVDYGKAA